MTDPTPTPADQDHLLAELPEMNPGPVCRLARDGTVELANRAARELFPDALVGRCWFDVSPRATRDVWDRALAGESGVRYEDEFGGRCFSFSVASRPGSAHAFVYGSDVTALKAAERELAELARFPEMNPGPVARLDRAGCIILANRAARELFGDESLAGRPWPDVCPGVTDAVWARVVGGDKPVRHDVRIGARDVTFTMIPPGAGTEVFVYGTDVTEKNESERALRQHERMATLGTLAAGLAHELNNPAAAARRAASHLREHFGRLQRAELALRAVVLDEDGRRELQEFADLSVSRATQTGEFSALARSDVEAALEEWLEAHGVDEPWTLAGPLVDLGVGEERLATTESRVGAANLAAVLRWAVASFEVQSLFAEVQQAATRLSEIVGAMKAYSFVGQAPLQAVDVNDGLRNTLIIMRSKLKAGVNVVQHLDESLRPIQAYGGDLNQVWTNLIDNAVAAMGGKGTLTLRTTRRDGGGVVVEVEDDGPGIPDADKSRIFDAFFTTKPPGLGTGLGLHTVYNIVVKKHGGSIDVASEPGRTRFIVTLPPVCPNAEDSN